MIKKGFDLFTVSPSRLLYKSLEKGKVNCCEVCTSPFLNFCKPYCNCRKATMDEWLETKLGKEWHYEMFGC